MIFSFIFCACNKVEETAITSASLSKVKPEERIIVKNVSFDQENNQFIFGGNNFDRVEKVVMENSNGKSIEFQITSQSFSSITVSYNESSEFEILSNNIVEIILSTATGAAVVPLNFTVADGAITEAKVANSAITTSKIANNSITNEKIKSGTIDISKIHNSGAANGDVVAWSDSENSWVSIPFSVLQSSDGAVESITPGTGFENEGEEIISTGTLNINVGNGKGEIPQFDETDGTLTFINEIILDSKGIKNGKILFNTDDDSDPEFTIEASGSGLSFIKDSDEKFYINSDGELVIPTLSVGGNYKFPEDDGTENQVLVTDGSGEVSWTSFSDLATDNLSLTATAPILFNSETNTISLSEIETTKIQDLTITNADISTTAEIAINKLAKFSLGDRGYVLISSTDDGSIIASDVTTDQLAYLNGLTTPINETFLHLQNGGVVSGETTFTEKVNFNDSIKLDDSSTFSVKSGSRINIEDGGTLEVNGTLTLVEAITSESIKNDTITTIDIKDETITDDDIKDDSITTSDIKNETITSSDILNGTIANADIASNAINSAKIQDNTITTNDILDGTIANNDIANSAINSAKIQNETILNEDIVNGTITASKISADITKIYDESIGSTTSKSCNTLKAGSIVSGGGCKCAAGNIQASYPDSALDKWNCACSVTTGADVTYVICEIWE